MCVCVCQVDILNNERAAKDIALAKEKNAHQQGQNQRDSLRQVRSTVPPSLPPYTVLYV